jgi:hypothetical protein
MNSRSHSGLLAGALAVHLVRARWRHERNLEVAGIALDRAPQRLPQPIAAPRGGIGNCSTPTCSGTSAAGHSLVRHQERERREAAVIEGAMLEER